MNRIPVSAIVMTKDEEMNIEQCLRGLHRFDEVFVIDSQSTDRTVPIAESLGAKVVPFRWNGRYPKKKQWCLENLPFSNAWVIYVDADEVMTPAVADEIARTVPTTACSGFFVSYDYVFLGKVLRHGRRIRKLVLMRHECASFPQIDDLEAEHMWEVEFHYQPVVHGSVGLLSARMVHDDHASLFHYLARHNHYSDWEALVRHNDALPPASETGGGLWRLAKRVYAALPLTPFVGFVNWYVLRGGFLDGRAGFHYAVSLSFYYWQIAVKRRERELRRVGSEGSL